MSQDEKYLRDVFAGLILNAIIPLTKNFKSPDWVGIAEKAYKIADEMMEARKAKQE